ncbi:hypothetical protein LCGC14_0441450 [marine sediment metagenome]|uniref:Uncharacterized protein n=1 Tax=marine sediment metagenome TaxID=412755 RepID=A0A0F9VUK2_9ZZZZ
MIWILTSILGSPAKAKKMWRWLRWVLLAAIVLAVGSATLTTIRIVAKEKTARVQAEKYAVELQGYYDTAQAAIIHKDRQLKQAREKLKKRKRKKTTHTTFDPVTGLPIDKVETEEEEESESDRSSSSEDARSPDVPIATPTAPASLLAPSCPGLRPLGFAAGIDKDGRLAAGLRWRLIPRVVLPILPDISVSIEGLGTDIMGRPGGMILADIEFWRPASR